MIRVRRSTEETNRNPGHRGGDHGYDGENVRLRPYDHRCLLSHPTSVPCGLLRECGCDWSGSRLFGNDPDLSRVCNCSPRMNEPGSNLGIDELSLLRIQPGSFHRTPWSPDEQVPGRYLPDKEAIVGGRKDSVRHDRRCVGS